MTVRDIQATLQDLYHVDVSLTLISKVTDVVNEEVQQWRDRPLEAVYPVVHKDHQVINWEYGLRSMRGRNSPAQVLTELNNRGVKYVFVFCVDGLTGFPEAIKGIYPKSDIQLCIVHMLPNSLKYVSNKNRKEVVRDLKSGMKNPLNGVIRSRIKTKRILGRDESALKIVWIAVAQASKKWTMPISNWHTALNHFSEKYSERIPSVA